MHPSLLAIVMPFTRLLGRRALRRMLKRNTGLKAIMGEHACLRFAFVATDLRVAAIVDPERRSFRVMSASAVPNRVFKAPHVTVAASFRELLALVQGEQCEQQLASGQMQVSGNVTAFKKLRRTLVHARIDLASSVGRPIGLLLLLLQRV